MSTEEKIKFEDRFETQDIPVSANQSNCRESVPSSNVSQNLAHEIETESRMKNSSASSQHEEVNDAMEVVVEEQNESFSDKSKQQSFVGNEQVPIDLDHDIISIADTSSKMQSDLYTQNENTNIIPQ